MPAPIRLLTIAMLLAGWHDGSPQTIGGHFVTIVQRDGRAGPVDAPSARVSARGRHVVFASYARLVPQDTNHVRDVYVFDLRTGQLTLESPGVRGTVANGESSSPGISGDGRYVVFVSSAGNLADTPIPRGLPRVFLRDRETETTRLLATSAIGDPANGYSSNPAISADGTTIVFESAATDLVDEAHAAGNTVGVYLIRRSSGVPVRLNVSSAGEVPGGPERVSHRQCRWPVRGLHVESGLDLCRRAGRVRGSHRTGMAWPTSTFATRRRTQPHVSAAVTQGAIPTARATTRP